MEGTSSITFTAILFSFSSISNHTIATDTKVWTICLRSGTEKRHVDHRPWKHWAKRVNWPPLFQVGVKGYLLTPTFNMYKACFYSVQNWHIYVLQSLYRVLQQNGHFSVPEDWKYSPDQQCTQAVSPTHASSFATCPPRSHGPQRSVAVGLTNTERVSLAKRWHYLNACSTVICRLFSVQCITVNLYGE